MCLPGGGDRPWAWRSGRSSRSGRAIPGSSAGDGRARFCAANEAGTFRVQGRRLRLPVVGWVRMREELRFSGVPKRVTVSREAGRWFASVAVDTEDVQPVEQPGGRRGRGPGRENPGGAELGGEYPRPEGAQAASGRAQVAQPGAVAQAQGLGQPQEGEGASRPAFTPRIAIYPPGCDAQGDDAYRQGLAAHRRGGPQRARHGGQPSAGRARSWTAPSTSSARQLDYKATMYGATVIVADRWYPSSRTCSCCGSVLAELDLSQRIYRCTCCALEIDRDLNAARNLEQLAASSAVTACGGTRSGAAAARNPAGPDRSRETGPREAGTGRQAPDPGSGQG